MRRSRMPMCMQGRPILMHEKTGEGLNQKQKHKKHGSDLNDMVRLHTLTKNQVVWGDLWKLVCLLWSLRKSRESESLVLTDCIIGKEIFIHRKPLHIHSLTGLVLGGHQHFVLHDCFPRFPSNLWLDALEVSEPHLKCQLNYIYCDQKHTSLMAELFKSGCWLLCLLF